MCMCVNVRARVRAFVRACVSAHVCMYVSLSVCVCVWGGARARVYVCMCLSLAHIHVHGSAAPECARDLHVIGMCSAPDWHAHVTHVFSRMWQGQHVGVHRGWCWQVGTLMMTS